MPGNLPDTDDLTLDALMSLVEENDPRLKEALLAALESADRGARHYAALTLAHDFHDARSLAVLNDALHDGDRALRDEAASAIWEIGDSNAPGLIRALHFERGWVRDSIVEALRKVGWIPDDVESEVTYRIATRGWQELVIMGEESVPGLLSALSDPDGNVRRGSAWALGQIGDPRAVPFLADMLSDTSGDMFGIGERVCDAAAEALERIGTPEAAEIVNRWRGEEASE